MDWPVVIAKVVTCPKMGYIKAYLTVFAMLIEEGILECFS